MTHEELLQLWYKLEPENELDAINAMNALRAVVEIHKPDKEGFCELSCVDKDDDGYSWTVVPYPCPTIQAIEGQLE